MERPLRSSGGASNPGDGIRLGGRESDHLQRPRAASSRRAGSGSGTDIPLRLSLRPRGPIHLGVSERQRADASVIHVDGELDILTAPRLATRINEVVRESTGNVVLDLRDVVFIDSAGLQVMLGARRRLARASRELTVVCREGPVRRVIEMARLIDVLGVVPDAD